MTDQADFFERNADFFQNGTWEDDNQVTDLMALIVLDPVPVETINALLKANEEDCDGAQYLWLADTYAHLPDYHSGASAEGTATPIDAAWQSPFIGKTVHDALAFIRNAPKPPKPLCKVFCAVLQKDPFEQRNELLICREVEGKPQVIPCAASEAGTFFAGFDRDDWEESYRRWVEEEIPL